MMVPTWTNAGAALCALGISLGLGVVGDTRFQSSVETVGTLPESATIADATGHTATVRPFYRIASGSTVADRLLVELCESDRILAFSAYGVRHSPWAHQYAGKAQIVSLTDLETILTLKPDLLVINSYGAPATVSRLREAGIVVFDLGEMRGLASLLTNIQSLSVLLGHPERGERFATAFRQRFEHVAAELSPSRRRRGLYLSIYGDKLFGAAMNTSHHDVLIHAGLIDVAAAEYSNWPQYSLEQVLTLDPEVIVTKTGMAHMVCHGAGLDRIPACQGGTVVEVPGDILDDPGPPMLDAAEEIFEAAYGGTRTPRE